jgi:hypothetical protein
MNEMGIAQAQAQFTKLLDRTVLVVDKKSHRKKAVIVPYEEYVRLLAHAKPEARHDASESVFSQFVGVLDDQFRTDDIKYNAIVAE